MIFSSFIVGLGWRRFLSNDGLYQNKASQYLLWTGKFFEIDEDKQNDVVLKLYKVLIIFTQPYINLNFRFLFLKAGSRFQWDRNIDPGVGCLGYPCPLGLRIYNNNLRDDRFNGYYIQTFSHTRNLFMNLMEKLFEIIKRIIL